MFQHQLHRVHHSTNTYQYLEHPFQWFSGFSGCSFSLFSVSPTRLESSAERQRHRICSLHSNDTGKCPETGLGQGLSSPADLNSSLYMICSLAGYIRNPQKLLGRLVYHAQHIPRHTSYRWSSSRRKPVPGLVLLAPDLLPAWREWRFLRKWSNEGVAIPAGAFVASFPDLGNS